ncbi:hypothetical protein SPFM1_00265 [Salmonella phage SPFM1]|nr:hypothetical protein SPFM1_00265 [Salmonella phage SPFM1]
MYIDRVGFYTEYKIPASLYDDHTLISLRSAIPMLLFEGQQGTVGFDSEDSTNATGKRFVDHTHIAIMLAISRVESPTNPFPAYALMDTFKYIQRKLSGIPMKGRVKPVTLVEMGGATEKQCKNEDIVEIINTASTVKLNKKQSMAEFVAGLETKLRSIAADKIPLKGWNPKHPVLVYTNRSAFLHYFLKQRANIRIEKKTVQIIAADSIDVRMGVCGNFSKHETALPEITDLTFQRRLEDGPDKVYSELSQIAYHEDLDAIGLCLLPKPQRGNWSEYELVVMVLTPRMREYMTEYKHNSLKEGTQGILSTKHLDFLRYLLNLYNLSEGTSPGHLASTSISETMTCKEMANQSICATCMGDLMRFEKGGYADLVGKPLVFRSGAYKAMVGMRYRLEGDNGPWYDCGTTHAHRYTFKDTQLDEPEYASRKLQLAANVLMYFTYVKESGATSRSHLYNTDKIAEVYTNQVWEGFFTGMHSVISR